MFVTLLTCHLDRRIAMNRYILSEHEHPFNSDYFYEANHITNSKAIYVPSHSHNYFEIYMYIRGEAQLVLNNHIFPVKKGDVVIIPPYYIHSLIPSQENTPYERMFVYITETCMNSFQFNEFSLLKPIIDTVKQGRFHYHITKQADYDRITYAIDQIAASKSRDFYGKEMMNRSYLIQLFTTINNYIVKAHGEKREHETTSLVSQVIAYLNENFRKDITLDHLCDYFYTNRQTLTRLFKDYTTMTIHNYITIARITQAKQLIHQGILPSKIHTQCGFNDYTTFYRAFKKVEGITPQHFYELSMNSMDNQCGDILSEN